MTVILSIFMKPLRDMMMEIIWYGGKAIFQCFYEWRAKFL